MSNPLRKATLDYTTRRAKLTTKLATPTVQLPLCINQHTYGEFTNACLSQGLDPTYTIRKLIRDFATQHLSRVILGEATDRMTETCMCDHSPRLPQPERIEA